MKKVTLGLLAASVIFMGGCIKKADNSKPILKVNGRIITENMYKETFDMGIKRFTGGKEIDLNNPQYKFIYLINKNGTINDLIVMELIKFEAEKRKLQVTDEEVESTIKELVEKIGGQEKFESVLAMSKLDEATFRKNIKIDILKNKLLENVAGDQKISDEDTKKFYEENKEDKFKHDDQVRASHILIGASEDDIKDMLKSENPELDQKEIIKKVNAKLSEAKNKAQEILQKAKANPEKFAELAMEHSDDTASAKSGGDLKFFPKEGVMVKEFADAAFATKPGEISNLVKTQFGYHIIKVTDRKQAGYTPYEEVAAQIKNYLQSKTKMETLKTLIETSRQSADIVYVESQYNPDSIKEEIKNIQQNRANTTKETEAKKVEEKSTEQTTTE